MNKRWIVYALVWLQFVLWPLHGLSHAHDADDHDAESDTSCIVCYQSQEDHALTESIANHSAAAPPHAVTPMFVAGQTSQTVRYYQSRAPPLS